MLNSKKEIYQWLESMGISEHVCHIHDNLTVDIAEDVDLDEKKLTHLPIQFGYIEGSFYCQNNSFISLKGLPYKVQNNFFCDIHPTFSFFDFIPKEIGVCLGLVGEFSKEDFVRLMNHDLSGATNFIHVCDKISSQIEFVSEFYHFRHPDYRLIMKTDKFKNLMHIKFEHKMLEEKIGAVQNNQKIKI
jgi:hypothetical protein